MTTDAEQFILNLIVDNYDKMGTLEMVGPVSRADLGIELDKFQYVFSVMHYITAQTSYHRDLKLYLPLKTNLYFIQYETLSSVRHTMIWSPEVDLNGLFVEDAIHYGVFVTKYNNAFLVKKHFRYPKTWPYFLKILEKHANQID